MTTDPITVDSDASLVHSLSTMFEHKFRHLPVLENGQVCGVLSCRDIPADYWIMWENWIAAQSELKTATG
jgi:signal-transduction protein with cAMP-binding, CBS, and nucleotidyltransferase domain